MGEDEEKAEQRFRAGVRRLARVCFIVVVRLGLNCLK